MSAEASIHQKRMRRDAIIKGPASRRRRRRRPPLVPSRVVCSGDLSLSFLCPAYPSITVAVAVDAATDDDVPGHETHLPHVASPRSLARQLLWRPKEMRKSFHRLRRRLSSPFPPQCSPSFLLLPLLVFRHITAFNRVCGATPGHGQRAGSALSLPRRKEEEPHRRPCHPRLPLPLAHPAPFPSLPSAHTFYDKWPCQYVDQRKERRPQRRRRRGRIERWGRGWGGRRGRMRQCKFGLAPPQ